MRIYYVGGDEVTKKGKRGDAKERRSSVISRSFLTSRTLHHQKNTSCSIEKKNQDLWGVNKGECKW